jgi:hypothetical protein
MWRRELEAEGIFQGYAHGRLGFLLPAASWRCRSQHGWGASVLTAIVPIEGCVLAANRWHCPLTDLAEKHTEDRSPEFDIYLPLWPARHKKTVFGALFLLNELAVPGRWYWTRQHRFSYSSEHYMSQTNSSITIRPLDNLGSHPLQLAIGRREC